MSTIFEMNLLIDFFKCKKIKVNFIEEDLNSVPRLENKGENIPQEKSFNKMQLLATTRVSMSDAE